MNNQIFFIMGGLSFFITMAVFVLLLIRQLSGNFEEVSIDVSWRGIRVEFVKKRRRI